MTTPAAEEKKQKKILGVTPNVFFMGLTSLLTDISSELIFTLVPLFLSDVLGVSSTIIGLVGGLSDSMDSLFRIFSGWLSDKIGKRKLLATLGYSISAAAKPFMLLANSWGAVLGVRLGDRLGKGTRSSSRDALIADSAEAKDRGRAFGLHRAMDTSGAVIGLIIAAIIIYIIPGDKFHLTRSAYHWMILIAIIPAVLAVVILLTLVQERKKAAAAVKSGLAKTAAITPFSNQFKLYMVILAVFTLGNSSDFFLILDAQHVQTPLLEVVLMLVLFNLTYAAVATPLGVVSDKLGRKKVISVGWLIYGLVYLGFALSSHIWQLWVLFAVYGVFYGFCEGAAKAFVADMVPAERRGTAYGL
ncbi:MAG TPA: MFS transporter, partial [Dehalococcoidales bacterium]|nr:MFS transporter [Dehalococcoidales bacterium]